MNSRKAIQLTKSTTMKEALTELEQSGNGFAAFTDNHGKLLGILTDGDVRRALLDGKTELKEIINYAPIVMEKESSKQLLMNSLKLLHRRQMPLVNEDGTYAGVFSLDDVEFNAKPNKVVVMAGGLGSRLGALTEKTPKPMLNVGGRPMLEHVVTMFAEKGFMEFVFCVNYRKEVIQSHFGDGDKFGVKISYTEEKDRLGTAGALSLVRQKLDDTFFVINADILTTLDFEELFSFHKQHRACATMCTREYGYQIPYGVVNTADNRILSLEEKPTLSFNVNAGIYVLEPSILELVPDNTFFDMPQLFDKAIQMDRATASYEISNYWVDIGKVEDYHKANNDFNVAIDEL